MTAGVRADEGGRHVVVTVPLPVAPEVVFDAVATGEGISSWFVPTAMEPQVGGRIIQFADPGAPDPTQGPEAAAEAMLTATVGEITEYTPPRAGTPGRFAYVERDWMGEGVPVPPWETVCEVRAGAAEHTPGSEKNDDDDNNDDSAPTSDAPTSCVLTLTSGFASSGQLAEESVDGSVDGWAHALTVLAHRLTHRPADGVVTVDVATEALRASVPELWSRVMSTLVAPAATPGAAAVGSADSVGSVGAVARSGEVGGIVARVSEGAATVILSGPVDGMLELYAFPAGETPEDARSLAGIGVRVYEYVDAPGHDGGPLGAAAVDVEPTWDATRWRAWLDGLASH